MKETQKERSSERMPRGAIATVVVGLVLSLIVVGIDLRSGGTSADIEWDAVERVETPAPRTLGPGDFALARSSISAIEPNASEETIFRIAGVVKIDSGGTEPTRVRCDIESPAFEYTIARTPKKRAAWPRPSEELQRQNVPEASVVKFKARGADVLGLPIRDAIRRYTDSAAPTQVDWDGFDEDTQNWVWTMDEGTGDGAATLGYVVIFKTLFQPEAGIRCEASIGGDSARITVPAKLEEWPLVGTDADSAVDAE
jgi:hypothetical protein